MHIADMKDPQAIKGARQSAERDLVLPEFDLCGVIETASIKTRQAQYVADQPW
jgi:hypothetical protein